MEYIVEYHDKAKDDLINYVDYIERNTFSKDKAEIEGLKIFYSIYEKEKRVIIFRILSSFQDYKNYL